MDERPAPIEVSKRISKVAANMGIDTWGYKSGLKGLDDSLLGFHGGELVVLAGRPSIGKTSMATSIAMGISKEAKTLYFSLELSSRVIMERMIAQQAELNYFEIKKDGGESIKIGERIALPDMLIAIKITMSDIEKA